MSTVTNQIVVFAIDSEEISTKMMYLYSYSYRYIIIDIDTNVHFDTDTDLGIDLSISIDTVNEYAWTAGKQTKWEKKL